MVVGGGGWGGYLVEWLGSGRDKERLWLQVNESDLLSIEPLYHDLEAMRWKYGRVLLQFRLKMECGLSGREILDR